MPRKRKKKSKARPTAPLISEGVREQYFFLPLTVILTAAAYYFTLCPTVFVGDSGELSTAAYLAGIPHSPGYPLYCIIGWLFSHMSFGPDVAFRMNVMSAVFALGTVVILYLIIYHFTRTPYLSFSISLAYAYSPIFWSQALVAEVYTLNTFLTALALYFMCRWLEKREDFWLYLTSAAMGLAVTNHQLSFLLLPTGLYFLWLFNKGIRKPARFWITLASLYVAGLLVYLYLPIRASADPLLNWGNPSNLKNFIDTVFKPAGAQTSIGTRWDHFLHALYLWTIQFSPVYEDGQVKYPIPIIWAFGIWGIYKGLSTGWRMAGVFVVFMLLNLFSILLTSHPSQQGLMLVGVYYLPIFLVFAVFMATGLREWLQHFLTAFGEKKRPVLLFLIILILVMIPLYQFNQNLNEVDRSHDYYARDYGTTLLQSCPPNSILIVNWDDIFTLWYLQYVEKIRTDVILVLSDFPTSPKTGYWGRWTFDELKKRHPEIFEDVDIGNKLYLSTEDAVEDFVLTNLSHGREVYFSFYGFIYDFGVFDFRVYPMGPIYQARQKLDNNRYSLVDLVQTQQAWDRVFDEFRNIYTYRDHSNPEEDFLITRLSMNLYYTSDLAQNLDKNKAEWFLMQSLFVDNANLAATVDLASMRLQQGLYPDARDLLIAAIEIDPANPRAHLLLGHLYLASGQKELAMQAFQRVLSIDPNDPEARALLERLGQEK